MSNAVGTPRVFAVQRPTVFDKVAGLAKDKYDLRPAEEFGKVVTILGPGKLTAGRVVQAMAQIRETLKDFSPADSVLAIGDPAAICATVMVAREFSNTVRVLRWDRQSESYEMLVLR